VAQGVRALLIEEILPGAGLSAPRAYATGTLISYAILVVGLTGILTALNVNLTALAVFGSALAVGLGFGLQNTINSMVSGFLLMFDPAISVGDLIEVSGERGVIQRIGIRNTTIVTSDGTHVVMPNATLANSPVLNLSTSTRPTRVTLSLPVPTGASPVEVQESIHAILAAYPGIREQPAPLVTLRTLTQDTMTFDISFSTESSADKDRLTNEVNLALWERVVRWRVEGGG
jgi:small-conductance mechanosensitive channel